MLYTEDELENIPSKGKQELGGGEKEGHWWSKVSTLVMGLVLQSCTWEATNNSIVNTYCVYNIRTIKTVL